MDYSWIFWVEIPILFDAVEYHEMRVLWRRWYSVCYTIMVSPSPDHHLRLVILSIIIPISAEELSRECGGRLVDTGNSVCHILRCYPRPLRIVEDHQVVVQTLPVSGKHRQPVTSLTPLSPHNQSYKSNLYLDPFRPTQARSSWRRQDCKWGQAWIWLTLLLVVSCDSDAGYSGFCTHPLIASNYGIQTNVIKHSLPSLSPDDKKCFHVVKNICR